MRIYTSYVEVSDFDVSLGFFAGETWHWNKQINAAVNKTKCLSRDSKPSLLQASLTGTG